MRLSVLIALGLTLVGGAFAYRAHRGRIEEQDRLGEIASALAKRRVRVQCPGFFRKLVDTRGELGTVQFDESGRPADVTILSPKVCSDLAHFTSRNIRDAAEGAQTLAHESMHLRGIQDEAVADCYGIQLMAYVAERLGATPPAAQQLAAWYYRGVYPWKPDDYTSRECKDGGRLDLRANDRLWP